MNLELLIALQNADSAFVDMYIAVLRYLGLVLALLIVFRAVRPLLSFRREPEIWAWLCLPEDQKIPLTHWENVVGSHKRCDVVLHDPSVSHFHAVFTRYDDGSWSVSDANTKEGVLVNGKPITVHPLQEQDVVRLGQVEVRLQPISKKQEKRLAQIRTKASRISASLLTLVLLSFFQVFLAIAFVMTGKPQHSLQILMGFGGIMAAQWLLFLFYLCLRRYAYEVETIAFFLCTIGMAVISTVTPGEAAKQVVAMFIGIVAFLLLGWTLRNSRRTMVVRYIAMVAGIAFLLATLIFGQEINGAKNWIIIGGFSIQPSELSKLCFVLVGAAAMDRIVTRKNLILFIIYSVVVCALLALMSDFGTALIFFCAFLVIAYMRSGSVGAIALSVTSLGIAGMLALQIAPHAVRRFQNYRHIWQAPLEGGYQQTRALMCMASGGLLGLGAGQGWMRYLFAADSDVAIATVGEEWGLIMVFLLIVCIMALGIFTVRSSSMGRSSFFTISGCTAAAILLVQSILNALGTVDVLPLTGVTFPFLSNGGSSMIAAWGLLAFIKAVDTRQNASFAVPLPKGKGEVTNE